MRLKRHLLPALRFLHAVSADIRATLLFWAAAMVGSAVARIFRPRIYRGIYRDLGEYLLHGITYRFQRQR